MIPIGGTAGLLLPAVIVSTPYLASSSSTLSGIVDAFALAPDTPVGDCAASAGPVLVDNTFSDTRYTTGEMSIDCISQLCVPMHAIDVDKGCKSFMSASRKARLSRSASVGNDEPAGSRHPHRPADVVGVLVCVNKTSIQECILLI